MLEEARLHFFIERTRPDAIRLSVTMVGERVEIDVFEESFGDFAVFGGRKSGRWHGAVGVHLENYLNLRD
jgi:hypothetical protein